MTVGTAPADSAIPWTRNGTCKYPSAMASLSARLLTYTPIRGTLVANEQDRHTNYLCRVRDRRNPARQSP